ncbi:hypothetical protein pb186bvf_013540 [Paramecium bursaria]
MQQQLLSYHVFHYSLIGEQIQLIIDRIYLQIKLSIKSLNKYYDLKLSNFSADPIKLSLVKKQYQIMLDYQLNQRKEVHPSHWELIISLGIVIIYLIYMTRNPCYPYFT